MSFDFFQFRLIFKYPKALGCWAIWAPNSQVYFHFCKMAILYGIWPPKCPCSRTVISLEYPDPGGSIFAKSGAKFAGLLTPIRGSIVEEKQAAVFLLQWAPDHIRHKYGQRLDAKNAPKLAYQYGKKTTFFLQKIPYYLPILERNRGVPRAKFPI